MNSRQKFIFLIFLIYKTSESLFQPSIRLYIYETVSEILKYKNGSDQIIRDKFDLINLQYENPLEIENEVQKSAANYIIAYRTLINIPAAILTIYWGGWSDKFGRKIPLILPCVGAIASCCMFSLALQQTVKGTIIAVGVIMVAVLIYGVFGKSALVTMSCNSYVVDCSTSEERTTLLSRLLGMNFFGIFFGSFLVGIIARMASFSAVLLTVSISCGILVLIIAFVIPETVKSGEENENLVDEDTCLTKPVSKSVKFNNYLWNFFTRKREGDDRKYLIWLILAIFWNQTAKAGEQDVILLYVKHSPMYWTDEMYGYYLATYYGCMGLNLIILLPLLERFFHPSDTILIIIGISMKAIRLIMMGSTFVKWQIFFSAIIGSSAGMIVAVTKSLMSKICEDDEIGVTFAITSAMEAFSSLIGPTLFNLLYEATLDMYIGTVFYIDACLQFCFLIGFIKLHLYLEKK